MRLWSLPPSLLDAKGLVALWREALLAQKVLQGETRGYRNHPQLARFKQQDDPAAALARMEQADGMALHPLFELTPGDIESWEAVADLAAR